MDHPLVLTFYGLTAVALGYCIAESLHHRRTRHRSAAQRLISAADERDIAAFRAQIEHHDTTQAVIAAATQVVDDALARHTHPRKEGGPTP
ncbi:hypothetical protein GPZ77_34780 (plasmid) [Streptomyces sp. QHH-9511]|uniref:hypothetical protein n=1 Tax=Streptomyces sp. QHH-9511 TaxID=2684468 RepID=UPI001315B489|nr:hypothetical protein [Streptomyces sp. QHH-9511]QGZ53394.1 hypothetical protein GPZ77_34780 [Streptomyces sp. QHH-9511]